MEPVTEFISKCFPYTNFTGFSRHHRVSPEILSGNHSVGFSRDCTDGEGRTKSIIVDENHQLGRTRRLSEELNGEINLHYVTDGADESHVVIECPTVFEFSGGGGQRNTPSSSSSPPLIPPVDFGDTDPGFDTRRKRANSVIDERTSFNSSNNSYLTTLFIETAKRKQLRVIHLKAIEESDEESDDDDDNFGQNDDQDQVDNPITTKLSSTTKKGKPSQRRHFKQDVASSSSDEEDEYWFSKWSRRPRLKKFVDQKQQEQQRQRDNTTINNSMSLENSKITPSCTTINKTIIPNNNNNNNNKTSINSTNSIAKCSNSNVSSSSNSNSRTNGTESQEIVQALNPCIKKDQMNEIENPEEEEDDDDDNNYTDDEHLKILNKTAYHSSPPNKLSCTTDVIDGIEVTTEPGGSTSNSNGLSMNDVDNFTRTGKEEGFTNLAFQPDEEDEIEEDYTDETVKTNTTTNSNFSSSSSNNNHHVAIPSTFPATNNSNNDNVTKTSKQCHFEESHQTTPKITTTIKHPLEFSTEDEEITNNASRNDNNTTTLSHNNIKKEINDTSIPSEILEPSKPLLFFIHGISGSIETWKSQIDYFHSLGYEILAMDLLGHGLSSTPSQAKLYHFESLVQDVVTVFDHFVSEESERQVIIIGHGYGACLATVLTRVRPKNVRILISIAGGGPTPMVSNYWCQSSWLSFPCNFFPIRKKTGRFDNPELRHVLPTNIYKNVLMGQIWLDGDPAFHRRITIPTLLVYGMRDKVVNLVEVCEMERTIPRAFLELIPTAGHMVMWDESQKLNRMIRKFIQAQWS